MPGTKFLSVSALSGENNGERGRGVKDYYVNKERACNFYSCNVLIFFVGRFG